MRAIYNNVLDLLLHAFKDGGEVLPRLLPVVLLLLEALWGNSLSFEL